MALRGLEFNDARTVIEECPRHRARLWRRWQPADVAGDAVQVVSLAQGRHGADHYLLDSEVHTFAFSVAANAILSFIPFIVLLYTLALIRSFIRGDGERGQRHGATIFFPRNQEVYSA